ncbi:MAG: hypothetical protein LBC88_07265, partial [Spirochaetaceae bacterium]|nr:hypothetical protein [Spirochaetaceae bacterium]
DTGADGYQLDTMHDIPPVLREKMNALRKGLVLTSQAHPSRGLPLELITTSWDEFWRADPMPEIDLLRFICPLHISPVISRWLRMEDKTTLINRAMFQGAPIVVWQDIFGRRLPFSAEQKTAIKQYKAVYLRYRSLYQGAKPIPLYPVPSGRGLYCNVFSDPGQRGAICSFYNDSDDEIRAGGIRLYREEHRRVKTILGAGTGSVENGALAVRVPPRAVLHLLCQDANGAHGG